jgi:hypothetical protein
MKLERRDFLKSATAGLGFAFATPVEALRQIHAGTAGGELRGGSGTLYLEGRLKSGLLRLEAQDFLDRGDRSVIIRGRLNSTELYSAMFSYERDITVFALFHDNDHSTRVALSNSGDEKIGRVVVWNDIETPQIFDIDKAKVMNADSVQEIMDVGGKVPDLTGKRKPPEFTWLELESVFGSDPALLAFMRGRKSTHHPREEEKLSEWVCRFLSWVPGSTLSLAWLGS